MSDRCYNKISIQRDRCGGPVCFIAMPAWADLCRAADRTEKRKEETKAEEFKLGILEQVKDIALHFCLEGEIGEIIPYGNGHINDTFRIACRLADGGRKRYILQKMNRGVFKNPDELMENVMNITSFLHRKVLEAGGDPERETLEVIPTKEGKNYLENTDGECWRMYLYIEDVTSFDAVEKPEDFYNSAVAFGNFQRLLADYPAATLHETIPNFHNTVSRLADFKKAVKEDVCGRAKDVQEEIRFVLDRSADCSLICDALDRGEIPLRVTHNDTKLNNILIDNHTGKGICVVDLDTVMPGSALYDYGDAIRFGASTGAEDEKNLDLISCDLNLYEIYTKGYLEGCRGSLTDAEIRMLPVGAKLMTLECGMRFLTDHLQNDVYFKIHRPNHNLDRARTQFKLVADMESKWEQMGRIAEKYLSGKA